MHLQKVTSDISSLILFKSAECLRSWGGIWRPAEAGTSGCLVAWGVF